MTEASWDPDQDDPGEIEMGIVEEISPPTESQFLSE